MASASATYRFIGAPAFFLASVTDAVIKRAVCRRAAVAVTPAVTRPRLGASRRTLSFLRQAVAKVIGALGCIAREVTVPVSPALTWAVAKQVAVAPIPSAVFILALVVAKPVLSILAPVMGL